MATKRLGRGLAALIHASEELPVTAGVSPLPLDQITVNPHQPRQDFDSQSLEELADSIREKGVLTPVTVRQEGDGYVLLAGERRWRASRMAKLDQIPAYVIEVTGEAEMMEVALIENIQRQNLNPLEEAEAYAVLRGKFNLSQAAIAKAVGKKRVTISNALRLLRLPPEIKQSLRRGEISAGHGRAILAMKTSPGMLRLWRRIRRQALSVRAAERAVQDSFKTRPKPAPRDSRLRVIEDELIELLGTKVRLKPKGQGGTILVEYYSPEDLERLLDLLREGD